MSRWVEVEVMNPKQSLIIMDFLLDVARRPRQFKLEEMISWNPQELNLKTSDRFLRDLRFRGLVSYEVIPKRYGNYTLYSNYLELLKSRERVRDGGYWITTETPVMIDSRYAVDVNQVGLFQ